MESEGAITACFYVQITRFFIWEIAVQRASFRFILRDNVGKKISLSLSIFFLLAVLPSCWNRCFHPLFFPSFSTLLFSPARVCFYLQTLLEGKSGTYCLLLLACGGKGEGLKVGHWPNGGSLPFD